MAKIKSKSAIKKRFAVTGSGKIKYASAYLQHNTSKRSQSMKQTNRGKQLVAEVDAKRLKRHFLNTLQA